MQGLEGDFENEFVRENVDNYLPPWLDKTKARSVRPEAQGHGSYLSAGIFVSKMIGGALTVQAEQDRQRSWRPYAIANGNCPARGIEGRGVRDNTPTFHDLPADICGSVLMKFPGLTALHRAEKADLECDQSELFHSHRSANMLGSVSTRVPAGILEPRPIAESFARATLRGRRESLGGNHAVIIRRVAARFLSTIGPGS
jgi:hypothetical protein